jgi:hypothetical protein
VVIPPLVARVSRHLRLTVLDVDVPDAIAVAGDGGNRIATGVGEVPGVEAKAKHLRIRPGHQRFDFQGRLDIAAAVMMKDRPDPGGVPDRRRHASGAIRKRVPLRRAEAVLVADPPGTPGAIRDGRVVV